MVNPRGGRRYLILLRSPNIHCLIELGKHRIIIGMFAKHALNTIIIAGVGNLSIFAGEIILTTSVIIILAGLARSYVYTIVFAPYKLFLFPRRKVCWRRRCGSLLFWFWCRNGL